MNDSKPFPSDEELEADIASAYAELSKAITEYASKVRRRGWSQGWDQGWDEGWEAGRKSVIEHFQKGLSEKPTPAPPPPPPPPPLRGEPPRLSLLSAAGRPAAENVFNYIEKFPGRRGVQIADALSNVFPERTVRTALHRLKNKKIRIVNGRWYTIEAAPADSQNTLLKEEEE